MSISQISVFVESKPGHLSRTLEGLDEIHVNVRGFSASDTGGYGIVRFVVDKPEEALAFFKERGAAVRLTPVLCVRLDDKPGELRRVLTIVGDCGINVVYCYSLASTYIVLAVRDVEEAEKLLADKPLNLINNEEIAQLMADQVL